jgi:hypothetical protein
MEFWAGDRLEGKIGTYPDRGAGIQVHPLKPLSLRLTMARKF